MDILMSLKLILIPLYSLLWYRQNFAASEEIKGISSIDSDQPFFSLQTFIKKFPPPRSSNTLFDAHGPLIFNTEEWHMTLWDKSDLAQRNRMREAFRSIFTSKDALGFRKGMFDKLPPLPPDEVRSECNPFFSGVDFCGPNGDCMELENMKNMENISNLNDNVTTTANLPSLTQWPETTGEDFFHCECHDGWKGRFCEEDIDECYLTSHGAEYCVNGATCVNLKPPIKYLCLCAPFTFGKHCDKTYPQNELNFRCGSTESSSLIDWIPDSNFKVLDYLPSLTLQNLERIEIMSSLVPYRGSNGGSGTVIVNKEVPGRRSNWYAVHKEPEENRKYSNTILRPAHWIKASNRWGFNFKMSATWYDTPLAYEHVVDITFPVPFLIRGFVVKGGYELWGNFDRKCEECKRLVTEYRISYRTGSVGWFLLLNENDEEIIFKTTDNMEDFESIKDLKALDIKRPRYNWLPNAFTAEALRLHVVDWWPKNLKGLRSTTNKNFKDFDKNYSGAIQDPVMRFDIIGCRLAML